MLSCCFATQISFIKPSRVSGCVTSDDAHARPAITLACGHGWLLGGGCPRTARCMPRRTKAVHPLGEGSAGQRGSDGIRKAPAGMDRRSIREPEGGVAFGREVDKVRRVDREEATRDGARSSSSCIASEWHLSCPWPQSKVETRCVCMPMIKERYPPP